MKIESVEDFLQIYPECKFLEIKLNNYFRTYGVNILFVLNGILFRIKKRTIKKIEIAKNRYMVKVPIEIMQITIFVYFKNNFELVDINIKSL